ncbi:MAG: glycosyltransferase family 4 protein, partial [Luteolibacter sp.]
RYECARFALSPLIEQWVMPQVHEGDNLIAGLGYFNRLIPRIQNTGGKVFLDARNSHPSNFWSLIAEEHARWDCKLPPIWPRHHLRQQRSVALADYILAPSRFVADTFVQRGFPSERVFRLSYPVDLSLFQPHATPRPPSKPLTLVSSGLLTLRKGSPYLFEALKVLRREIPDLRIKLIHNMADSFKQVYERNRYAEVTVEWAARMPHSQLVEWLRDADLFLLPTIEEGMVRSAAEALGCGLPVITTRNAGVDDFIVEGVNGSIVPIRDPQALAAAVLSWWDRIRRREHDARQLEFDREALGFNTFAAKLTGWLGTIIPLPDGRN